MKSGQIIILVLLVVVVALAIGLSVASRNIINLRTSTQTEQSQRAFNAAEGGVENILPNLTSIGSANVGSSVGNCTVVSQSQNKTDCTVTLDNNIKANVNVLSAHEYERPVSLGDVAQIDLKGASGQVQIDWAKPGENAPDGQAASLEVTQIYGSSPYNAPRLYFQGGSGRNENGSFSTSPPCTVTSGYTKCVRIDIQPSPQILRIKPFWGSTTVKVSGANLPLQTYDITATASTDIGVTRKVKVTRTVLPQLPAVFDYVLYSEGDIVK